MIADVVDRLQRRIGLAIAVGERVAIALQQRAGAGRFVGLGKRLDQPIGPGAHDRADLLFQGRAVGIGRRAGLAADDEMHAGQRRIVDVRIVGADVALEHLGEIFADLRAHLPAVALARHIDQHRDEAVEAVAPRQHAHPRALLELQDAQREMIERVLVDLEQLVARIGLQHVDQRLAGMRLRIEAGAGQHGVDLAAQDTGSNGSSGCRPSR